MQRVGFCLLNTSNARLVIRSACGGKAPTNSTRWLALGGRRRKVLSKWNGTRVQSGSGPGEMRSRGTISKFRMSLGRLESSPLHLLLGIGRRVAQSTLFEQLGKRARKDVGRLDARLRTVRNFDHRNRRELLKTPRSFEA